jgi:dolichyl-phosphate-mannose-protein mannosyltransferase
LVQKGDECEIFDTLKFLIWFFDWYFQAQIHLLGNIFLWYSATFGLVLYLILLVFYLLRRCRRVYDLNEREWTKFQNVGYTLFCGYLINYLPYFFVERTLFLHNYLPALLFKISLLCYVIEHINFIVKRTNFKILLLIYKLLVVVWLALVIYVFQKFTVLSYGQKHLTADECLALRWKDTWDFIFS